MYKVYKIDPVTYYRGMSLVAADDAKEANRFIDNYKKVDTDNYGDSLGYCYVDENDLIDGLFAEEEGIVYYGIIYSGC